MIHSDLHMDFADRAYEISCAHKHAPFLGIGCIGLSMYNEFLQGKWSLVMVVVDGRIHIRYMPSLLTQFLFDAYGT